MSGGYTLTVTDAIGCSGSVSTPVIINPLPNATIASSGNRGCAPLCVTFTVLGTPGMQNTWTFGTGQSSGGMTAQNCYGTSGVFTITADYTDANGCSNASSYTVETYPVPVADFNWAPIKPIINQDKVDFTDASYNGDIVSWNWYFTNQATAGHTSSMQNPNFYYEEPGSYPAVLIVKTEQGCTDTVVKVIVVGEDFNIYVPNAFTPNGDGINDVFQPKGFGIVKYELQIFDRWGERLFQTNTFEQGWDGIRQKKNDINYTVSKQEVYVWKINATDVFGKHHEYTGHVTLIK
jgi:gliding motility-associated-like protein